MKLILIRAGILMAVGAAAIVFWIGRPSGLLIVTALDVGQGDAIYIRTPGGNDILIDGGPANGRVLEALERHLSPSNRTLELVVLTHPDADHVGGLPDVAEKFSIPRALETGVRRLSGPDRRWEEAIAGQDSQVIEAKAGNVLQIDEVRLTVLWPTEDADRLAMNVNDTSVVLRIDYGTTTWLFTGDIESGIEERLLQLGRLADVDVLKVGHHGSITSSSQEFLDVVKPEIALISSGKGNSFGHPHPVVIRRLERLGAEIFRTDMIGDIVCQSDGRQVSCRP